MLINRRVYLFQLQHVFPNNLLVFIVTAKLRQPTQMSFTFVNVDTPRGFNIFKMKSDFILISKKVVGFLV